jgi:hypothetical protein
MRPHFRDGGNAEGYQMQRLATSDVERETVKTNQALETLKYSQKNPAINATTPIAPAKRDRPNATMSNPIAESWSFDIKLAMVRIEIPVANTKRYAATTANNPATVLLT